MARLFVSLNLPEEIRDKINALRIEVGSKEKKLKWEPKEKLHLTLKFIGDVEINQVNLIAEDLAFIENFEAINCETARFGFFFTRNQPRILWMGLHADKIIFNLVEELNSRLEKFLIPRERKRFTSHITILRIRGNVSEEFVKGFQNFDVPKIKFRTNEISLMKSDLLPLGSVYNEIKKYQLK
jgi:RNA 2',3'-cyclic 3'-phosphodiesterase